jgi:N-acetylneuraminic acid mutarotase
MTSIGTDLYVFGGCGAENRLNDLYKFDTNSLIWTQLSSSNLISGRGGPTF